jgi:hypothetical protein
MKKREKSDKIGEFLTENNNQKSVYIGEIIVKHLKAKRFFFLILKFII